MRGATGKAFLRDASRLEIPDGAAAEVIEGDATSSDDVARAVAGASVVVSCLGSAKRNGRYMMMMHTANDNILRAAAARDEVPRCIFISGVGCGGTSWILKQFIILSAGRECYEDFEGADRRVREEGAVPFLLVRPYFLTNGGGKGSYHATTKGSGTFMRPIARADVAKFLVDAIADTQWDDSQGVLLGGAGR